MLRIDVINEHGEISLTVQGRLAGRWVCELERCWRSAGEDAPHTPISVSLAAVTCIDPAGRDLLTRMRRTGVTLVPTGLLMDVIVREIEDEVGEE
jgi:hypothetical protein